MTRHRFGLQSPNSCVFEVRFFVLLLFSHGVDWDCDVIADNGIHNVIPIGSEIYTWNVRFDSRLILSYFLNYFASNAIKCIKNGFPCTVEMRGTQGCALATSLHSLAARAGSPNKATVKPAYLCSHLHDALATIPDNKVHGTNMGPIWGREDPGGSHVGPMNFAIWDCLSLEKRYIQKGFVWITQNDQKRATFINS